MKQDEVQDEVNQENYGENYWCIMFADGGLDYICADRIEVQSSGALVAWGGFRKKEAPPPEEKIILYALAAKKWNGFYAASRFTSDALCGYE